ncbi:hypothetical protein GGD71_006717 [Variovorax guangxiensis]|uniref:Tripartite tricarboxylate transporter substrate binding protein n=1 Tax=Variovorax guangxiensis TaxID=1775474 RepID=A0A840G085_9BURK|nr:hypothetical protein [Variovorax guangxiensis]
MALLANSQLFLITRATLAGNNSKDFIAHAKANPDKMNYGSAGKGSTPHLAGELLKQSAGITATHVPYRGAARNPGSGGRPDRLLASRPAWCSPPSTRPTTRPSRRPSSPSARRGPDGPGRLHVRADRGDSAARLRSGLADPAGLNRPA